MPVSEWKPNHTYFIEGGFKLEGKVNLDGAKNAITKQLVASLLTDEQCTFHNVPRSYEISIVLDMLKELGSEYSWVGNNCLTINSKAVSKHIVSEKYSGSNRIPILLVGPLIHKKGLARIPMVGGCNIGPRPIDFHVDALTRMGATIEINENVITARSNRLFGNIIKLPYPSIGATENILLTAVLSKGVTVIENAAMEPEIIDTILFLQKMGALVQINTDRQIIIEGVSKLSGATHRVIPDRIEAASFAIAAIATDGNLKIIDAKQEHLVSFLNAIRRIGGEFFVEDDGIRFFRAKKILSSLHLETDVYPGFATDWQPPFAALLTQANGVSIIHETVYENRLGFADSLIEMGASIDVQDSCLGGMYCRFRNRNFKHSCIIQGPAKLKGKKMAVPDLRAGFAYIIAALMADGVSQIRGIPYVERGYGDLLKKLSSINARIEAVRSI